MNRKLINITFATVSLLGLAQFTAQRSADGKEKPKVNFYGTLVDQSGNTYAIENITISGMYSQIPVYVKPRRAGSNPDLNKRFIDLEETAEIRVPYEGDSPRLYRYKDREFIEIEVVSNDTRRTTKNYIVERTRKLFADEQNQAGPLEMQLGIEAIDVLTIQGHKEPEKKRNNEVQQGD